MCTELSVSHPDHSRGQGDVFIRLHILNPFLIPAALTDKSETFLEKGSGNGKTMATLSNARARGGIIFFHIKFHKPFFCDFIQKSICFCQDANGL